MDTSLPLELLSTIQQHLRFRQAQSQQLSSFYNEHFSSPQVLVAHGLEETYKLETIENVLHIQNIRYAVVNCRECLSQRHVLSKIFARCLKVVVEEVDLDGYDRIDSINALVSNLRKLFQAREEKLVLVIVGADQQRGSTATLFPALARLGELIPCMSLILTSNSPRPLLLRRSGVLYIHFPPFKRDEAIHILLQDPPPLLPVTLPLDTQPIKKEKLQNIFSQFATVVYDTLIAPTTNSISKYRQTAERLWPRFIWPLIANEKPPGGRSTADWDFARLLSRNRILFQSEGEGALQERLIHDLVAPWTFEQLITEKEKQEHFSISNSVDDTNSIPSRSLSKPVQPLSAARDQARQEPPLLGYLGTLLLLSSYLASHTPQRHDIVLFSRLSTASSTSRRKRKYLARSRAGGITKTPTKSPSKKATRAQAEEDPDFNEAPETPSKSTTNTPKKERADRSMRAILNKTSHIPRPFTLERVVAILRAIHPEGVKMGKSVADRVYVELGELERLRLVVRDNGGRGKGEAEDVMEEKWRCAVGREWVVGEGRKWGVSVEGWEFD